MAEVTNFEEPLQNNNQEEPNKNNIPEPFQNNALENNILEPYKSNNNNLPESDQNNVPASNQNDIHQNNLNQGIANEELNKKMRNYKIIFLTIMFFIFIAELVAEFFSIIFLNKPSKKSRDSGSNYGEGLIVLLYVFIIYPILIVFSSIILCCSCKNNSPNAKIKCFIVLCIIKGAFTLFFFGEDNKVPIFGLILEILNIIFLTTAICYQNIVQKYLFSQN